MVREKGGGRMARRAVARVVLPEEVGPERAMKMGCCDCCCCCIAGGEVMAGECVMVRLVVVVVVVVAGQDVRLGSWEVGMDGGEESGGGFKSEDGRMERRKEKTLRRDEPD